MIELGALGFIESGDEEGFQIKILDDSDNTGGFLILTSKDLSDKNAEAFDSWVSSYSELERYFYESNWVVKWL